MNYSTVDTLDTIESLGMIRDGMNVLDLGCGYGHWAWDIKERNHKVNYIGLDSNIGRILAAESKLGDDFYRFHLLDVKNALYSPMGYKSASSVTFPIKDSWADLVICHSLFTHLEEYPNAVRYMDEIRRVTKSGSYLWITFFQSPPNEPSNTAERTVYTAKEIDELMDGFKILSRTGGLSTSYHDQVMIGAQRI